MVSDNDARAGREGISEAFASYRPPTWLDWRSEKDGQLDQNRRTDAVHRYLTRPSVVSPTNQLRRSSPPAPTSSCILSTPTAHERSAAD
jgi:hypothetical protein